MINSMNISWWVKRWSELHPAKTAVLFEGESMTYSDLHRKMDRTSCWLQDLGIEKGDRVAVMLKNCPEFLELYLASSSIGAIFVPVNFRLAAAELDYILINARPRLFVFESEYSPLLEKLNLDSYRPPLLLSCVGDTPNTGSSSDYHSEVRRFEGRSPFLTKYLSPSDPVEPQVIMYTSGTTGQPKGAVLTYRKTFFNCLNAEIFFKLHFDDIMLILLPLFHSGGLFIQASPAIYKGATLIIHPKFDPLRTYQDIEQHQVTKLLGVPTVYKSLLGIPAEQRGDLSSLNVCAIGGEKTTAELLLRCRDAGFPLRQIMGQTETSILLWASEDDFLKKPGSVGRPVFHAEVELVDKKGQRVKTGETGEIVVRGSILMREYWMDPKRTTETIQDGRLHTGDLARMDEDGYFYLVDRVGDMFISGGENVYPTEVERVLEKHPDVKEVAVVGIEDDTWGEVGHAYIICENDRQPSPQELIDFCREQLAAYKVPKTFTFCSDFPRTALGKTRKHLLDQCTIDDEGS
jgi:fatty-acyl-CoA synthase